MDSPFPFLRTHAASSAASVFVPKSSISSWGRGPPRTFRVPSSRFSTAHSPPLRLPFSNARRLPVAALSGRRAKRRRNHLREKLLHDRKVRPSVTPFGPDSDAQAISFDGILESDSRGDVPFDCGDEVGGLVESKRGALGESALWSRLENWVDQYKNDLDLWGVGSAPIFTVFHDPHGNVKRVNVDEGEILKRSRVVSPVYEDMNEVNSKIARARGLASEMESGSNVIPRNSSVAKFVVTDAETGFVTTVPNPPLHSALRPKVLAAGTIVLCGVCVLSAVKWFFTFHKREVHYTQLEKEMMRRKIKARQDKEKLEKGHLEVVREALETPNILTQRPHLDKRVLAASIQQANTSSSELAEPKQGCSNIVDGLPVGFDGKIKEIRELAKRARETEGRETSLIERYEGEKQGKESLYSRKEAIKQHDEDRVSSPDNNHAHAGGSMPANKSNVISTAEPGKYCDGSDDKSLEERNGDITASSASATGDYSDVRSCRHDKTINRISDPTNVCEVQSLDALGGRVHRENAVRKKPKIIRSVKEAREYLSSKFNIHEGNEDVEGKDLGESWINSNLGETTTLGKQSARVGVSEETTDSMVNASIPRDMIAEEVESIPEMVDNLASHGGVHGADVRTPLSSQKHEASDPTAEASTAKKSQNWIEENSNVVEPILGKIGDGFRNNYMIAREKSNQHLNASIDLTQLHLNEDNGELEWMKDDKLREIVFQVRENELTGKDPFYSMDAEDKRAFFAGLEKKVEKVNVELLKVHEYLHSNIENLDYGADGISIYDPVEKIIPRWKEPPVETKLDFVNKHLKDKKASMTGEAKLSPLMKKDEKNLGEKSAGSQGNGNTASSLAVNSINNIQGKDPKKTKILIEGSDGSVRTGKKSGKEYWQHTKKWSRGFLDSYSAETDPEVKSVMKDIGKDLDRWITEKEIQEAAELMDKLPERNKEYIGKKLNKLKREMELFGPHAVVSKYREYAEDKDEDYLWWLDLPHVLCIELYTHQNGEQKFGFYSLEMAADLELEPKPHHVIAFEDAGDCKNLCYIIQAHMDMLGNGQAFIVPLPPKDAFREAKANGFGVTVVRKGEIQLNVDQPLEEVEQQLTEIGSKLYHDKIMQERSVDVGALMKGVFGVNSKPSKRRRLKRARKKPSRNKKTK